MEYVFFYKVLSMLVGLSVVFMGYKLFVRGIFNESGNMEGSWKDTKLILSKAAPGTYFVLFGSAVIAMSIYKGYATEHNSGQHAPQVFRTADTSSFIQAPFSNGLPDSIKIH